jgi:hypothetical protein
MNVRECLYRQFAELGLSECLTTRKGRSTESCQSRSPERLLASSVGWCPRPTAIGLLPHVNTRWHPLRLVRAPCYHNANAQTSAGRYEI